MFIKQMSSPYSVTPALTTHESAFETAEATATENIAEKTKSPSAGAGLHRQPVQQQHGG